MPFCVGVGLLLLDDTTRRSGRIGVDVEEPSCCCGFPRGEKSWNDMLLSICDAQLEL